ncbi:unnamed protein product [Rhizophagus irregularis]|nr:unnamed protein product [Rhizophagus irregularis]
MLIWLRECENSSTKKDKIIKPYYHSLFWWRKSSFDMINNQKDILKKDLSKEDVSKKDLSTKDISNKDLSKEDVSKKDLSTKDISNKDLSREDLSNKDLSNKDPSKEDISKEDISKDIPKSISKDIPKSISKDIPKSISKNIPNGISKNIPNGISKDISNGISKDNISKRISNNNISKDISNHDVSKDVSKDILSNQNQNIYIPVISSKYILTRLISFIKITTIQEFWLIFIEYYMPNEISSIPYPIRFYNYFTSSDSDQQYYISPFYMFYCAIYTGIIYWNMIWIYEIYLFVASCLLYYIQSTKKFSNSIFSSSFIIPYPYNKLLIKLKISKNFSSLLEQWLYHFLFFTNPLFDSPHLSCSPSEFWSKRWHLLYRNCFVELGYLPCKRFMNNYYPSFLPHKKVLSHIFGTFAGFLWSCIFHEYVIHSLFGLANGEHFTFFLFHGIIAIFWEIIVTLSFRKNDNTAFDQKRNYYTKKVIGFVLWNSILILSAPWFAEPYIRAKHYYCYPHFGCDKGYKGY